MPRVRYLNIVVITVMFAVLAGKSCSVEKNTAATRAFHNLVSHYNIYFNGKESYLEGIRRARESFTDDYTNILPLFYYEDESIQQNVSPQMKRAMDKATKVITFHSITSKPKIKKGRQSPKDKAFYEKNEYNKWIDDSYMLIGKAYMYQGEFFMAAESFKHVINNFPEEDIYYAAIAWLMRAYNVIGDFDKSEELSMALEDAEELPKDYLEDINLSLADYYLRLEEYEDAVEYIKKALDTRPEKSSRIRFNYILAQLYNEIGDGKLSIKHYKKVIRMNPPYEMTFNSKVSMAEAFQAGSSNSDEIKRLLFKMLKDSKNEEFQDQIYFALGNILMEEGEREQAIEYYHLSVTTSVRNDYQKGQSCLTLAEIYYSEPKYTLSAAYYDTAVNLLDPEYPNYENLQMRSASLSTLVTNLNTYQLQDSLQKLASMTEEERFAVIDAVIADVREQEEQERQRQQQAMQDLQFSRSGMMNQSANSGNNQQSGTKWYFYNLNLKSYGQPEFRMKWGDRKLEDNWRRRNKQSVSEIMQTEGNEEVTENGESVQVLDDKSREYYIRDIPLTDSAMEVSHRKLEEALYHVGLVYKNDLLDYDEAISVFEELIQRYPQGNYTMASYYYLYDLYNAVQNISKANYYKERLSTEYPDSHMAKLLTNPNYIRELEAEQQKVEDFYMKTYTAYKNENFNQVISLANQGIENYPDDEGLQQRLSYLKAMSTGAVYGKEAMKNELDSLIAHYPGTELANEAQEVKDYMFVAFPVMEKVEKAQEAEVLYHFDTTGTHYFLLALKTSENLNLVNFNLLNYNLDNFNAYDLDINLQELGQDYNVLMIDDFNSYDAVLRYANRVRNDLEQIVGEMDANSHEVVLISEENYNTLLEEKEFIPYLLFYRDKYQN